MDEGVLVGVVQGAGYLAVVEDNRVFHNTGVGLYLSANATNRNNRIYDNLIGVQTDLGYTGTVNNNLIYDNSGYGVLVSGTGYYGGTPTITISGKFINRDKDNFTGFNGSIPSIMPTLNAGCTIEYALAFALFHFKKFFQPVCIDL